MQLDALKEAGCKLIFEEKVSGVKDRPELDKALAYLREGDTFVIWKLDRLGRSLKDLVYIVDCLQKRKVAFKSIVDGIDTNSALGRCQFGIFASLAEYEREIIVERTRAGLQAAKERGKLMGRPIGIIGRCKEKKAIAAKRLYENRDYSIDEICRICYTHWK
ncbi:MAG: recombinase family protein [Clostridium paraputrificum]